MRFSNELERRHGVVNPVSAYPVPRERAARRGRAQHRRAPGLPRPALRALRGGREHATRTAGSRGRARRPTSRPCTSSNRWVGFPYPKNMNAIMEVDQAAALVVMAASEADRLGIPPAQRVTFLGGGRSVDGWSVSERAFLDRSPAYAAAANETKRHAALGPEDVDLFDFYSCFPCVVEFAHARARPRARRSARLHAGRAASRSTAGPATPTRCTRSRTWCRRCGAARTASPGSRRSA